MTIEQLFVELIRWSERYGLSDHGRVWCLIAVCVGMVVWTGLGFFRDLSRRRDTPDALVETSKESTWTVLTLAPRHWVLVLYLVTSGIVGLPLFFSLLFYGGPAITKLLAEPVVLIAPAHFLGTAILFASTVVSVYPPRLALLAHFLVLVSTGWWTYDFGGLLVYWLEEHRHLPGPVVTGPLAVAPPCAVAALVSAIVELKRVAFRASTAVSATE